MDRVVLRFLSFRKVFQQTFITVMVNQVDGLYFFELFSLELQLFDSSNTVVDKFHHFYGIGKYFKGLLVDNEDESHGAADNSH